MSADFQRLAAAIGQRLGQFIHHRDRLACHFDRAGGKDDLAPFQHGSAKRQAFLGAGQATGRVQPFVIAHLDREFRTLSQPVGQQARDDSRGVRVAGDAAHDHPVGFHLHAAIRQFRQRGQPRQHPHRPAGGQGIVQPGGNIDIARAEPRAGKGLRRVAHAFIRQAAAHLHRAFG